jgi:hypothetical protein
MTMLVMTMQVHHAGHWATFTYTHTHTKVQPGALYCRLANWGILDHGPQASMGTKTKTAEWTSNGSYLRSQACSSLYPACGRMQNAHAHADLIALPLAARKLGTGTPIIKIRFRFRFRIGMLHV